jgi:hypothetical protein
MEVHYNSSAEVQVLAWQPKMRRSRSSGARRDGLIGFFQLKWKIKIMIVLNAKEKLR